jgi:hypothetical protein
MKTIQAPNGKCYEVEDMWQPMETVPKDGEYYMLRNDQHIVSNAWLGDRCIAWMPVPSVKEVQPPRWRAEKGGRYFFVRGINEDPGCMFDNRTHTDNYLYSVRNYFRTPDAARNSNKWETMNDPNSEAAE